MGVSAELELEGWPFVLMCEAGAMSVEVTATIAAVGAIDSVEVSAIAASEELALRIIRSQLPLGWQIRSHTLARTASPSGHPDWPGSRGLRF